MRVPTYRMQQSVMHLLNRASGRIEDLTRQIATGKRLHKPSDDPASVVRAMSMRKLLEGNAQYQRNISDALRWNKETEHPLTATLEALTQMKELATRGANDAAGGREALAQQADHLLGELISASEARVDDRYVFSGFRTYSAPYEQDTEVLDEVFVAGAVGEAVDLGNARIASGTATITDLSGGVVLTEGVDFALDVESGRVTALSGGAIVPGNSYRIDYETKTVSSVTAPEPIAGEMLRLVDKDRTVTVNLTAPEVFQSGIDLFQLGIDLKNALWKDDGARVGALIDQLDRAVKHVSQMLGVVGARVESLDNQTDVLASDEVSINQFLAELEDTDLAQAAVELQSQRHAYEAALAAASRLLQTSIVNRL